MMSFSFSAAVLPAVVFPFASSFYNLVSCGSNSGPTSHPRRPHDHLESQRRDFSQPAWEVCWRFYYILSLDFSLSFFLRLSCLPRLGNVASFLSRMFANSMPIDRSIAWQYFLLGKRCTKGALWLRCQLDLTVFQIALIIIAFDPLREDIIGNLK